MKEKIYPGFNRSKLYAGIRKLVQMREDGLGDDLIMFAYADAPYHIVKRMITFEIDGQLKYELVEEKIYDYPMLTVNEAIVNYHHGRKFWEKEKNNGS
jgi:hypothetical protein